MQMGPARKHPISEANTDVFLASIPSNSFHKLKFAKELQIEDN